MATKVVSQSIMDAFARVLGLLDQTRDELDSTIGQLGALTTVEKTDVVGAVNEVNETSVSKLAKDQVTFDLSYQILVPTNKGCVVEGGFLPVYQLVDPKFEWVSRDTVSVRKGPGASTVVNLGQTRLVNGNTGDVRKPKPTDFATQNGVTITVAANGDVMATISHARYPNSETLSVGTNNGASIKHINYTATSTLTPDEFMRGLYVMIEPTRLSIHSTHGSEGIGMAISLGRDYLPYSYTLPKISKIEYVATILDDGRPAPTTSVAKEINVFGKLFGVGKPNPITQAMRNTSVVGQTTYTFTSADMGPSINETHTRDTRYSDGHYLIGICGPFSASNRHFYGYAGHIMETPKSIKVTFADGTVKEKQLTGYRDYGEYHSAFPE